MKEGMKTRSEGERGEGAEKKGQGIDRLFLPVTRTLCVWDAPHAHHTHSGWTFRPKCLSVGNSRLFNATKPASQISISTGASEIHGKPVLQIKGIRVPVSS